MRIVEAGAPEIYWVHKMFLEYLQDTGQNPAPYVQSIGMWLERFAQPGFFCFVSMHGKKACGMAWGVAETEGVKSLNIEGFFVRRGFRGRFSVTRQLVSALRERAKGLQISRVRSIIPLKCLKLVERKGFTQQSLVMERAVLNA